MAGAWGIGGLLWQAVAVVLDPTQEEMYRYSANHPWNGLEACPKVHFDHNFQPPRLLVAAARNQP